MSLALTLEASSRVATVALFDVGAHPTGEQPLLIAEGVFEQPQSLSSALPEVVASLLDVADASVRDVSWLIAGVGPGSLTGLRVGLGYLQGLARARHPHTRCTAVSSLRSLALPHVAKLDAGSDEVVSAVVLAVASAGRGELFAALSHGDDVQPAWDAWVASTAMVAQRARDTAAQRHAGLLVVFDAGVSEGQADELVAELRESAVLPVRVAAGYASATAVAQLAFSGDVLATHATHPLAPLHPQRQQPEYKPLAHPAHGTRNEALR